MKIGFGYKWRIAAMTFVETMIAMGVGTVILGGFTAASVALQKSMVAIEDYAKGQNDQMRISDYLSLDMRRAFTIAIVKDPVTGVLTVTMTIPNFYQPIGGGVKAGTPHSPYVKPVQGWAYKRHHHHKHQNVILNQIIEYGPYNAATKTATGPSTLTVTYVFDNGASTLTRNVNGVAQMIATDVKDFNVSVSDLDETAQTQITFKPRFNNPASAAAIEGTTYYQTTLTRNTR